MPRLALLVCIAFTVWLFREDIKRRRGLSSAVWIPTLWLGILASRPLSTWLGIGGALENIDQYNEGSPVDRLFYLGAILAAFRVLSKRQVRLAEVVGNNRALFLFYGYLLISVLWSAHPFSSFKRWFKDIGNIAVLLVILTEADPEEALKAVFCRCAYLLIPLSELFIKYFPDLGRVYNMHSGEMMAVGVTFQKNSLGAMILVCGLPLIWDLLSVRKGNAEPRKKIEVCAHLFVLFIGLWLLRLSDSKTSIFCLILGTSILLSIRIPLLKRNVSRLGAYAAVTVILFLLLDSIFNIRGELVGVMGRDMTFTGRTDVWQVLLNAGTDPIFGTGFCSFWSDDEYRSKLPDWVAYSAHNGYLETYIDGGMLGVSLLLVMLAAVAWKINRFLAYGTEYGIIRFAFFVITIIYNLTESVFGRLSPNWFVFLLIATDYAGAVIVEKYRASTNLPSSIENDGVPVVLSPTN